MAAGSIAIAISSVEAQTCPPQEVIIVDDGSTDATVEIAQSFQSHFPFCEFCVVRQTNQGPGAARNRGLNMAQSELIAFLDADDEWLPEHLEKTAERLLDWELTLVAHNEFLVVDGVETLNDSRTRFLERNDAYVAIYRKGCISTSTVIARRDAIVRAGGFDISLRNGQDVDLWLAILQEPDAKVEILETPLSKYVINPAGINANISRRHRYFIEIARRWSAVVAKRPGGSIADLWFRVAAIHYETFKGHMANGHLGGAIWSCLPCPVNLIDITLKGILGTAPMRPSFLATIPTKLERK
jgi:glycosyltransferase involved in cell wall biosynthesis